jgi:hypothetical protein
MPSKYYISKDFNSDPDSGAQNISALGSSFDVFLNLPQQFGIILQTLKKVKIINSVLLTKQQLTILTCLPDFIPLTVFPIKSVFS